MSYLYIDEPGISIKIDGNRLIIQYTGGDTKELPIETVEGISVFRPVQLSAKCMQVCLQRNIPVHFYTGGGIFIGQLQPATHINPVRQRLQSSLYETEFALELAKRITIAKIRNQDVVLKRYGRSRELSMQEHSVVMRRCSEKVLRCKTVGEVMGCEGYAARTYFSGLALLIEPEFVFQGRNKRPAKDPFNALLNLGYAVLRNTLLGSIEMKGLNPYFGFLHRDRDGHPTLASDLMEEWRAVIVDSTAMAVINGHELRLEDFYTDDETGACMLTKDGLRLYLHKLEEKLKVKVKYLKNVPYSVSFRQGILLQMDSLIKAMEQEDVTIYQPVQIR